MKIVMPVLTQTLKGVIMNIDDTFIGCIEIWIENGSGRQKLGVITIYGDIVTFYVNLQTIHIQFEDLTIRYKDDFAKKLEHKVLEILEKSVRDIKYNIKEDLQLKKVLYTVDSDIDIKIICYTEQQDELNRRIQRLVELYKEYHACVMP